MVDTDAKDYIDLKLGTVQAQLGMAQAHNDAQFAIILQKLESMPTKWSMLVTVTSAAFAVIGAFIGFMAFGGDRFDSGMSAASISVQDAIEAREIATRNSEEMQSIQADLDAILTLLSEQSSQ